MHEDAEVLYRHVRMEELRMWIPLSSLLHRDLCLPSNWSKL